MVLGRDHKRSLWLAAIFGNFHFIYLYTFINKYFAKKIDLVLSTFPWVWHIYLSASRADLMKYEIHTKDFCWLDMENIIHQINWVIYEITKRLDSSKWFIGSSIKFDKERQYDPHFPPLFVELWFFIHYDHIFLLCLIIYSSLKNYLLWTIKRVLLTILVKIWWIFGKIFFSEFSVNFSISCFKQLNKKKLVDITIGE
jgi:hypothetical protein